MQLLSILAAVLLAQGAPIKMAIVGDSTVSVYMPAQSKKGWGQFIQERFKSGSVQVNDLAMGGRSSKSFMMEGFWQKALDTKPNIVLIQFGHNDSHKPVETYGTDAKTSYEDFLQIYVDEARAIGAKPVLVTPMVRRTFDAQGHLIDGLSSYASAMMEVAQRRNVPVVDLHAMSLDYIQKLGPQGALALANDPTDGTHWNEKGARAMAGFVMQGLIEKLPELKPLLKDAN